LFRRPVDVVVAREIDQVLPRISELERAVGQHGLHAVGFLAYEAAPAFDPVLAVRPPSPGMPLLCFGLFEAPEQRTDPPIVGTGRCRLGRWTPSQTLRDYRRAVARIREYIAAGDSYQVNYTIRLHTTFEGDPRALFVRLLEAQPDGFASYLDLGSHAVCSASPELFFRLDHDRVTSRPMKGTAARGYDLASDLEQMAWLRSSEKNRAENAMIVDMVRNDLGRVADVGTVRVSSSFDVERHPTVLQMTSTVRAMTSSPPSQVLAAMFPFASVTGAPKVRTMEIIRDLETAPRGVYTGAIGFIAPDRQAQFSVAIRTAVVDREAGSVEYGVGGGIVWDSAADEEYRECRAKARIITRRWPSFDLLETLRWDPVDGYRLLERHLARLCEAADYFGRPLDLDHIRAELEDRRRRFADVSQRVRLLVAPDGTVSVEAAPIEPPSSPRRLRLGLAIRPIRSTDPFVRNKTTHRGVYRRARSSRPDCDDVLLENERGEVTESTTANLVVAVGGELVTPPLSCGLLPGTFRAELLERGQIGERLLRPDDVATAEAVFLVNSVRGWIDAEWIDTAPAKAVRPETALAFPATAARDRSDSP
jgi:para-aminobenzoate synthetase/4-amino-4-deoxychorismate lyase